MRCGVQLFTREDEIEIIAGHAFDKLYEVFYEDGTPCNISIAGTIIEWTLCQYGYKQIPLVVKTNTDGGIFVDPSQTNEFTVHVDSADTEDLAGLHTSQVTITDPLGFVNRTSEGSIIIRGRIVNLL